MITLLRSASLLALASFALAAHAQNLVVNPGFETGSFSGYTVTEASSGSNVSVNSVPHTGAFGASFGAISGLPDTISQSIATVPGQSYTVSYFLRIRANDQTTNLQGFTASFGGTSQTQPGIVPSEYTLQSFNSTATSTSTTLSFAAFTLQGFFDLDDVSVVATPVPEPASLAALGLGAVALLKRRKRA